MPTPWERDLEQARKNLGEWLATKLPDATDIAVSPLTAPSSSGFSNETLLFDLAWKEGGRTREEALVVRIQPSGYQVFPHYDLGLQFKTMALLASTDVPVPKVFWLEEENRDCFGAPFYVMGQVQGRVPTDNPPYHSEGWMTEIGPEDRRAIWLNGFEAMAKIHRLDHAAVGFDFLDEPERGATGLERQIAYFENYLEWAARGRTQPTTEVALEWIKQNRPSDEPSGLVWGDARIGNIIFHGTTPAAVLDWEMVCTGSPEMDVGWAIFLDKHHSEGIDAPRLPGFPSYEETIAHYERHSGHRVAHLHYYEVFAGFRFAVIMIRIAQQLVEYGIMDAAAGAAFELNNTVTRMLAKLLDLPAPGASTGSFAG